MIFKKLAASKLMREGKSIQVQIENNLIKAKLLLFVANSTIGYLFNYLSYLGLTKIQKYLFIS